MSATKTPKASEKTQICNKLVKDLQSTYKVKCPDFSEPVLETILFAICLEDNAWEMAEAGYRKLLRSYFDLNEIRVTSIFELEQTLAPLRAADWKGLRIRALLRHVYESTYEFQFEKLRKLTQDQFVRALRKISELSTFVRDFSLQQILGSHIICFDQTTLRTAQWLGLVPVDANADAASEFLKAGVRKADAAAFSFALRQLAMDPKFTDRFAEEIDAELSIFDVMDRLKDLRNPAPTPAKSSAARAASDKSKAEKTPAAEKKVTAKRAPARTDSKKSAAAKAVSGKSAAKKSVAKQTAAKGVAERKSAGKPTVKKPATKKPATKKATVKKAAAGKSAAKQASTKKAAKKSNTSSRRAAR